MRIKLDENLPVRLVNLLAGLGFDVDTAANEGLSGASDERIWEAAQAGGRFLITQDLDFSDLRRFAPGSHQGVLLVRLPEDEQRRITEHVASWLAKNDARSWSGCFVVATPRKIRVLRPPKGP